VGIYPVIYPIKFHSTQIYYHQKFEKELQNILEESGYKEKFIPLFYQRLKYLEETQERCIIKSDWFEVLKGSNELYSMKFKGMKNIRIIFMFTMRESLNLVILLCGFEEKNAASNSKTGYKRAIKIAGQRREEIFGLEIEKTEGNEYVQ
jgi:hypothetical protein